MGLSIEDKELLTSGLKVLTKHQYLDITTLPENDELFAIYQKFIGIVEQSDNLQEIIDILKNNHQPSNIEPGTIGAELYGCLQNYYGDIDKDCSALCMNSIFNKSFCTKQIWVQTVDDSDMRLIRISGDNDIKAGYIYINKNFLYFTKTEKQLLSNSGLKYGQILDTNFSKHYAKTRMISIDDLPDIDNINNKSEVEHWRIEHTEKSNVKHDIQNDTNNYTAIIIIFLLILLVIIGLVLVIK